MPGLPANADASAALAAAADAGPYFTIEPWAEGEGSSMRKGGSGSGA